jgi:hypothetical protein
MPFTFSTEGAAERHLITNGFRWVGNDNTGHWSSRFGFRRATVRWAYPGYRIAVTLAPPQEEKP